MESTISRNVTGGKSLAVLAQTFQTQLSALSARRPEGYFLPRTLVLLRRTSAGTEEHVTLHSAIYKHRVFRFTFRSSYSPRSLSYSSQLRFIANMEPAKSKNEAIIARAKDLANVPWCEEYEKMISGML
jgi:hypothetical protein